MRATARPSRNTTLSRLGSLWVTSRPRNRAGTGPGQAYGAGSKASVASWSSRSSTATLRSAASSRAQAGYGGVTACPWT